MSNILTAFFSASGVTKAAAEKLSEAVGSDIYEIKPKDIYTDSDLNWRNPLSRVTKEQIKKARPELADYTLDISGYDEILLCFPIWYYAAPNIIHSFLEAYDFTGKKIVLFATSGGSVLGKSRQKLLKSVSEETEIVDGCMLNNGVDAEEIKKFL